MNAHQRRYSMRRKKRKFKNYLTTVKVIARMNSDDIVIAHSDKELLDLFSRNITFTDYPAPPIYWYKKWERN